MKIERLSENQIRCTLYKSDLEEKELLLSELAYGTDKAKELFREMMQQASEELGFEVDNIPLMIEAIPVSQECLVLIVTKVEDPDELDTRFSRFTKPIPQEDKDDDDEDDKSLVEEFIDNHSNMAPSNLLKSLGGLVESLKELGVDPSAKPIKPKDLGKSVPQAKREMFRIYAFKNLDQVILSAKMVDKIYKSENSLYKNPKDSKFYLYMTKDKNSEVEFIKVCNLIGEYGNKVQTTYATPSRMAEHYKLIIEADALQKLSQL